MALFPRKYRSLLYKLVVIVPVLWLKVMLIAHNSNSGTSSDNSNLVPSGSGPGVLNANDVQAVPRRKVLDGEGPGVGNHDDSHLGNNKQPSHEEHKVVAAPTKKVDEIDR